MNAAEFVLDTLSHFVKRADEPSPGVPARFPPGFETELSSICVDQGICALVSRSLDSLALPPAISRLTAARLRREGERERSDAERRLRRLAGLVEALDDAGVPALVMGDALSAATLYDGPLVRPVHRLELLVDETHAAEVLRVAEAVGFSRRRSDPSVEPTANSPATLDESRHLLEFHHYMTKLLVWNADGDGMRIRFRAVDVGHPARTEGAMMRARTVAIAGVQANAVSLEDHLLDLAMRLGASRYGDLGAMTDLGLILRRQGREVQWGHVVAVARFHGVHTALRYVLGRVERVLRLGHTSPLAPPRRLLERWLDLFWKPGDTDYARGPDERNRFVYGLIACGGPMSKLRWLWRYSVPRRDWVERVVGDARHPWNWLAFQMLLRERLRPRARGARGGDVTRFDRKDRSQP